MCDSSAPRCDMKIEEFEPSPFSHIFSRPATFLRLSFKPGPREGRVFVPGDDGYDNARQTWNVTTFDQRPAIVVMPSIAADVASAVSFARQHNLPIAVQGGGHGHPHPANDALLVNFASMTSVEIMPVAAASGSSAGSAAGMARAEAGGRGRCISAAHPPARTLNGLPGLGFSG